MPSERVIDLCPCDRCTANYIVIKMYIFYGFFFHSQTIIQKHFGMVVKCLQQEWVTVAQCPTLSNSDIESGSATTYISTANLPAHRVWMSSGASGRSKTTCRVKMSTTDLHESCQSSPAQIFALVWSNITVLSQTYLLLIPNLATDL